MKRQEWINQQIESKTKKPMPVLSFPSIQLLGIGVKELIMDSNLQAEGMRLVAERTDASASVSMMDLSVEAEAFGSSIHVSDDEVPTVVGHLIDTPAQAEALKVPEVGAGRTGLYIEAIKKASALITDRPVFAGVIGPYSLAGRLLDVTEAMIYCYDEPEMVHTVLKKVSDFLTKYMNAYKAVGASGVVIAEPLAGLLSPALAEEFSCDYLKQIINDVQDDDFTVVYHNCGNGTVRMINEILSIGAAAYHFGNAIDMRDIMPHIPKGVIGMGNVDPSSQFFGGTPESIREVTLELLRDLHHYDNYVISSGCDIPPMAKWENIDAFFAATAEFYAGQG